MSELPRSVRLALWATAVIQGRADIDAALEAVTADDDRHRLTGDGLPFSAHPAGPGLADWLEQLSDDQHCVGVRALLLPTVGLAALPGGQRVFAAAEDAGEAVVTLIDPSPGQREGEVSVLVPSAEVYGPPGDQGVSVCWKSFRVTTATGWSPGVSTSGAEQHFRTLLNQATDTLTRLDLSPWQDDSARRIGDLRRRPDDPLPPGTTPRLASLIDLASRVAGIGELARQDDGGAVSAWQADTRFHTLGELQDAARQALSAATIPPGWS